MSQQQNREIAQRFGERLKAMRGEISRVEFARSLGLGSPQALENYEKGRIPPAVVLAGIARKLGLTMEQLLFSDQQMHEVGSAVPMAQLGVVLREPVEPYRVQRVGARLSESLKSANVAATELGFKPISDRIWTLREEAQALLESRASPGGTDG